MTFKVGDWVVYQENWPRYKEGKAGIVVEAEEFYGVPYIRVEFVNRNYAGGFENPSHYRPHLGEGDVSPYDTEQILGVPYGDGYNHAVRNYWESAIERICHQWEADPQWELEDTPGFEWARGQLLEFRREVEAERAADAPDPLPFTLRPCGRCGGSGYIVPEPKTRAICPRCNGKGFFEELNEDYDALRVECGELESKLAVTAERDALKATLTQIMEEANNFLQGSHPYSYPATSVVKDILYLTLTHLAPKDE